MAGDHLGGHVLGAAAIRIGLLLLLKPTLAQSEIRHYKMPSEINNNVLRLEVSVKHVLAMQKL